MRQKSFKPSESSGLITPPEHAHLAYMQRRNTWNNEIQTRPVNPPTASYHKTLDTYPLRWSVGLKMAANNTAVNGEETTLKNFGEKLDKTLDGRKYR